ncbi:MAG: tetratricopeptide repeat protein [bacterium]|nr:tetratricopeptide repeat protein [bacterium]
MSAPVRFLLCLLLAAAWPAPPVQAAEETPLRRFAAAQEAYQREDFPQAVQLWQSLLDEGYGGGELVYNLGNAHFRQGDLGRAVLNWERALLLDPRDRDARANLDLVRARLADQFDPHVRLPLWDALDGLLARLPSALLAWATLIFALGAAGVGACRYVVPERRLPAAGRLLLAMLMLPALAGLTLLLLQDRRLSHRPRAVLLAPKVEVRAAPSPGATAQFDLHVGTTVVLLREGEQGWCEIELPDGRSGWVPPASVELVNLPMPGGHLPGGHGPIGQ